MVYYASEFERELHECELPAKRVPKPAVDRTPDYDAAQLATPLSTPKKLPPPAAPARSRNLSKRKAMAEDTVAKKLKVFEVIEVVDVEGTEKVREEMRLALEEERESARAARAELYAQMKHLGVQLMSQQEKSDNLMRKAAEQEEVIKELRGALASALAEPAPAPGSGAPSELFAPSDDERTLSLEDLPPQMVAPSASNMTVLANVSVAAGAARSNAAASRKATALAAAAAASKRAIVVAPQKVVRKVGGGVGSNGVGGKRGDGLTTGSLKMADSEPTCWGDGGRAARPPIPFAQITDFSMRGIVNEKAMQLKLRDHLGESKKSHAYMYTQAMLDLMALPGTPEHFTDPEACVEYWGTLKRSELPPGITGKKHLLGYLLYPTVFNDTAKSWTGADYVKDTPEYNRRKVLRRRMVEYMRALRNMDTYMRWNYWSHDDDE